MMKFKVGDKVKFLNESGGGVVSKIINPSMVNVAIEDGFEIPVLTSEILKIDFDEPMDSPKHMFREDFNVKLEAEPETIFESDERNIPLLSNTARGTLEKGVYFAFLPHDQKWLITGMMDVYLVNHTPLDILYNLYLEDESDGYRGFDYGSINPESMILLDSIEREDIGSWTRGIVQVLYHAEADHKVLSPGNSSFKIKPARFYKETGYKNSSIIDGKTILISLLPLSAQASLVHKDIAKDKIDEQSLVESKIIDPEHIIDKHKTSPREAVVDLHLYELVEDSEKLENSEALRIQVNYFTRCLENAIANEMFKITFIHGVGSGVLKTTIKEILKEYPNVEYREGSMKQFGYGALDVIIRGS